MKLSALFLSLFFVTHMASASVLNVESGSRSIEGVNVGRSAVLVTASNTTSHLDSVGAGLRTKKVLVANVKVYVAQIFVDNIGKFVRTEEGALESLENMSAGAIHLTFLRNVDAPTVQVSFRDALDANDVDLNNPGIASFLAAVKEGADAKEGKSMNISLQKNSNGLVTLVYENTLGAEKTITGDENLFKNVLSIWLGEPADAGLETLKKSILKGE